MVDEDVLYGIDITSEEALYDAEKLIITKH